MCERRIREKDFVVVVVIVVVIVVVVVVVAVALKDAYVREISK